MTVRLAEAVDIGNDVLVIRGYVDDAWTEARGWVSATTNHYDSPRDEKSQPREMNEREKQAYFERLLIEAAGGTVEQAQAVLFLDPTVEAPTVEEAEA